jgi:hypothetical protein
VRIGEAFLKIGDFMKKVLVVMSIIFVTSAINVYAMDWMSRQTAQDAYGQMLSDNLDQVINMYDKYGIALDQQDEQDRVALTNLGLQALAAVNNSRDAKRRLLRNFENTYYNLFQSFASLKEAVQELMGL